MYLFHNDYNEGCHPKVLQKLIDIQSEQMPGYGLDPCCGAAADKIRSLCKAENAAVHFLVGGTQTNLIVIAAALRPHQAVLAAQSGHINVHETGAIEATGHKVVALPSADGKLTAAQIVQAAEYQLHDETAEHVVQIKMVYISNTTELGTVYTRNELEEISAACKQYGFYLFMDGARLGYALSSEGNDVTLADLARLCDAFYIGGTKCGAMFGEAVVITNPMIAQDFRYLIKQRGAMLAKGWLIGTQFRALLEDDLYFEITAHANRLAQQLRDTLHAMGYQLLVDNKSNQVFPILPNKLLKKLSDQFTYSLQEVVDDEHKAVRFCTSWATTQQAIDALCNAIEEFS